MESVSSSHHLSSPAAPACAPACRAQPPSTPQQNRASARMVSPCVHKPSSLSGSSAPYHWIEARLLSKSPWHSEISEISASHRLLPGLLSPPTLSLFLLLLNSTLSPADFSDLWSLLNILQIDTSLGFWVPSPQKWCPFSLSLPYIREALCPGSLSGSQEVSPRARQSLGKDSKGQISILTCPQRRPLNLHDCKKPLCPRHTLQLVDKEETLGRGICRSLSYTLQVTRPLGATWNSSLCVLNARHGLLAQFLRGCSLTSLTYNTQN